LITAGVLSEPSGKVGKQNPLFILSVLWSGFRWRSMAQRRRIRVWKCEICTYL